MIYQAALWNVSVKDYQCFECQSVLPISTEFLKISEQINSATLD